MRRRGASSRGLFSSQQLEEQSKQVSFLQLRWYFELKLSRSKKSIPESAIVRVFELNILRLAWCWLSKLSRW